MVYANYGVNLYSQEVPRTLKLAPIAPCNFQVPTQHHSCIAVPIPLSLMPECNELSWDPVASQRWSAGQCQVGNLARYFLFS